MKDNETLAFDAKVATYQFVKTLKQELKNMQLKMDEDLLQHIWVDRPSLPNEQIIELPLSLTGESVEEKLQKVRQKMDGIQYHLISSLDDIAYLFNLRGNDIPYNPVFLSYALISQQKALLFVDLKKVSLDLQKSLNDKGVTLYPYEKIYSILKTLNGSILLDPNKINYALYVCLDKNIKIFKSENPTTHMKAIKNQTEIENSKKVHIQDGVAFIQFMHYIKTHIQERTFTELEAEELLLKYRQKQKDFQQLSF